MSFFCNFNLVEVAVQIDKQSVLVHLKLNDKLSIVRTELGKNSIIKMDDTLSFAKKTSQLSNNGNEINRFAEIAHEDEDKFFLSNIIVYENPNILYLTKSSNPNWKFLNDKCKLDYGCIMTNDGIKRANEKAFKLENCELENTGVSQKGTTRFSSNDVEEWMMKTNLLFTTDIEVQNFINLGLSIGTLKKERFKSETNLSYEYTKHSKLLLKFKDYLKPTEEYIKDIENAINSKKPESFLKIIEKFGQFIPTEIVLGGRVHLENCSKSSEKIVNSVNETSANIKVKGAFGTGITGTSSYSGGNTKSYNYKCKKLIGGVQPEKFENFDEITEETWIKSLVDYRNLDCIEFQKPINIFQFLPDNLRKQIFLLIGKKVLYSTTVNCEYWLNENGRPEIVELRNIPPNILTFLETEEADCNIFARVFDTEESKNKNDFFTWQILQPINGKPCLIIHCIQKNFRKRKCKLKIGWMIIGYKTDLNFVHSDFNNIQSQFDIQKKDFKLNNQPIFKTEFEYNFLYKNISSYLGISVLDKLDSSNNSLIIGHHFFNVQKDNKIGARTFSYCSKNKYCANLPNFTFCILIVSGCPNSSSTFGTISFEKQLSRKPYINFTKFNLDFNSIYINLVFTNESYYHPICLKQKSNQIKIKYLRCIKSDCYTCKNNTYNTLNISEEDIRCVYFDPCYKQLLE
ncbi:unnamed protein product [Rhizophagus irregularis]|nr:unnamed protein product [Rhizophagus irregularis]